MKNSQNKVLVLQVGEMVSFSGNEYVITKIVDLDSVLAKNLDSGKSEVLKIWDIKPTITDESESKPDNARELEEVSEEDWAYARRCLETIAPLLSRQTRGNNLADQISNNTGHSRATLYRWLRYYRNTGLLSSLLPVKRAGGRGKGRLAEEIEVLIEDVLQNYYLTDQKPTITDTAEEVRRKCNQAGLPLPHPHTVRKRIEWIEERERLYRRKGRMASIMRYEPNEGSVPDADWPLAVVQIDHTLVNVIIVHEVSRQPIRRAWITLMIDVYSRMILGMYLTLDAPSAMSAGMCISHAILPKERWLEDIGVKDVQWPCWGVMGAIHMDNAREFRGDMLKVACNEYGIDLLLRPVKTPHYGGHIERLMGTVSQELTKLPGATFSNPKQRGEYDSEGQAVMSMKELEEWLVLFISKYHHRIHGSLGMSPYQKFREGLLGGNGRAPRGLPARRLDEEKVRLDFMPFVERTVQPYGVVIDDVHYFSDILRPWVGAADPDNPKASRIFRFKRDPRDISQLYFFDPNARQYFTIPYRDISLPPISLEELRDARKAAKAEGYKDPSEQILFDLATRQREVVDTAAVKSKTARMQQQKRMNNEAAKKLKAKQIPKAIATAKPAEPPVIPGYNPNAIQPFDDEY